MLSQSFSKAQVRQRIRANPLGPQLEQLHEVLLRGGYCRNTIHQYLQAAEHFGRWVAQAGRLATIDEGVVRRFLRQHLPRCRCSPPAPRWRRAVAAPLRHLLRLLRSQFCGSCDQAAPPPWAQALIDDFDGYMQSVCGLSEVTRRYRCRYATEFLAARFGVGRLQLKWLAPADSVAFVSAYARRCSPATAQVAGSSLRCFFRFLHLRGLTDCKLAQTVPRVADWGHSRIPEVLDERDLRRFLASFDRSTATGQRDYAMALCMVEEGLRVGEVAQLRLEDVDWRHETLRLRGGKSNRGHLLPLPGRIVQALAVYLRRGRPHSSLREVFLRHRAPLTGPVSRELVRGVIRRAYQRCGFNSSWTGTHILRRTAASRMYQGGASLKQIADILGHRSIDTSATYTRTDLAALSKVGLPWPEVQP